jgi:hypothetical protein
MGEHTPWPHDQTLHAWWVVPGRLLADEYPGARTPGKAAKKYSCSSMRGLTRSST